MSDVDDLTTNDQPWANTDQVPERFQAVAAGEENAGPHSVSAAHLASHAGGHEHHGHQRSHHPLAPREVQTADVSVKMRGRAGQTLREMQEAELNQSGMKEDSMQQFGEVGPQGQPVVGNAAGYRASEEDVLEALRDVIDPELGINIVDLGLVYGVELQEDGGVRLEMTLTSAACPLTDVIEEQTNMILSSMATSVDIEWVWMPPWGPDRITEEGRDQLRALGFNV